MAFSMSMQCHKVISLEIFAKLLTSDSSVVSTKNFILCQRLTFRFRNFCHIFDGFGFGFGKIWFRKKNIGFGFKKNWPRKKVSVSVSENLVSEKKSRYRFRSKLWYRHSVLLFFIFVIFLYLLQI